MKFELFLAILIASTCSAVRASNAGEGTISVTVMSCLEQGLVAPNVTVREFVEPARAQVVMSKRSTAHDGERGIYTADFQVPVGVYTVTAETERCKVNGPITASVFPDKTRHLVAITSVNCCSMPTLFDNALAVQLPDGVSGELVSTKRSNLLVRHGVRDEGILYFEGLVPDKYELKLSIPFASACVQVIVPSSIDSYHRLIDITPSRLRDLMQGPRASCASVQSN